MCQSIINKPMSKILHCSCSHCNSNSLCIGFSKVSTVQHAHYYMFWRALAHPIFSYRDFCQHLMPLTTNGIYVIWRQANRLFCQIPVAKEWWIYMCCTIRAPLTSHRCDFCIHRPRLISLLVLAAFNILLCDYNLYSLLWCHRWGEYWILCWLCYYLKVTSHLSSTRTN